MGTSRRDEILKKATEIFERQGVNRTSFEDIARAVGITREAIYYYFKSRMEILLEVLLPQSEELLEGLERVIGSGLDSIDKLHAAIQSHLDGFNPNYLEMTVALREDHFVEQESATKLQALRQTWDTYSVRWTELIREGQRAGVFNPELNPKMVTFGILGMCNWLSRWYDPNKEIPLTEIIDTYFTMTAYGLVVPELSGRSGPETAAGRRDGPPIV